MNPQAGSSAGYSVAAAGTEIRPGGAKVEDNTAKPAKPTTPTGMGATDSLDAVSDRAGFISPAPDCGGGAGVVFA